MTEYRILPSIDTESMTAASDDKTDYYDTEVESAPENHEAVTPDASQTDMDWDETAPSVFSLEHFTPDTPASDPSGDAEDIMTVAYALCGLSRG